MPVVLPSCHSIQHTLFTKSLCQQGSGSLLLSELLLCCKILHARQDPVAATPSQRPTPKQSWHQRYFKAWLMLPCLPAGVLLLTHPPHVHSMAAACPSSANGVCLRRTSQCIAAACPPLLRGFSCACGGHISACRLLDPPPPARLQLRLWLLGLECC
jgi:hypothetical protein